MNFTNKDQLYKTYHVTAKCVNHFQSDDLQYKDCVDMKGTMTSSGGILRTEFAQLYVPPGR